jgi:hypothetical protein
MRKIVHKVAQLSPRRVASKEAKAGQGGCSAGWKIPPKEKDDASDEPLSDEEPIEVLSEESSGNSLGQRRSAADEDEDVPPPPAPATGKEMVSESIEEDKRPNKKRRAKRKVGKRKR